MDFVIHHIPGSTNTKADLLSRRSEYASKNGGDENHQPVTEIITKAHFAAMKVRKWTKWFTEQLQTKAKTDKAYQEAYEAATTDKITSAGQRTSDLTIEDGMLYRKGLCWIPEDMVPHILESEHDSRVAGHFGQEKTEELIRRNFWWPNLRESITA